MKFLPLYTNTYNCTVNSVNCVKGVCIHSYGAANFTFNDPV
jgi:hypothetical protein